MKITKAINNRTVTLSLAGRLDTITSSLLSKELDDKYYESIDKLILDFQGVEYMSSAGLRVIIDMQKKITSRRAKMELTGVNESIKSIFDITGFSKFLTIN